MKRLNVEAFKAVVGETTPGPWSITHDKNDQPNIYGVTGDHWIAILPHQCVSSLEVQANANARAIVALHNAASDLFKELAALRALEEAVRNVRDHRASWKEIDDTLLKLLLEWT